jgi:hypothetical protein
VLAAAVVMVKLEVIWPAGTVTVEGTVARGADEQSVTGAPATPAGAVSVICQRDPLSAALPCGAFFPLREGAAEAGGATPRTPPAADQQRSPSFFLE